MKKVIFISGGSSGFGKALAAEMAKEHQVVILARSEEETAAAAKETGCDYVLADVADGAAVQKAVKQVLSKYGRVDVLVNNAGIWIQGPLEENDPARIKTTMDVNATGTILLTHALLGAMKKAGSGRIINVISQAGLAWKKERSVYNASKWAITGFTKSLADELHGTGVTVAGFYPGPMKTALFEKAGIQKDTSKAMELADAVRAVTFIIDTPDDLEIPELGITPTFY